MDALPAVAGKAFFNTNNAHMEVFLIANLLILHESNAQATARNIHHQHACALTTDFFILQCVANGDKFGIYFLRHINDINLKAGFAIDLVQQKDLIAGLAHGSGSLELIFLHAVFHHKAFKALQNIADFGY